MELSGCRKGGLRISPKDSSSWAMRGDGRPQKRLKFDRENRGSHGGNSSQTYATDGHGGLKQPSNEHGGGYNKGVKTFRRAQTEESNERKHDGGRSKPICFCGREEGEN